MSNKRSVLVTLLLVLAGVIGGTLAVCMSFGVHAEEAVQPPSANAFGSSLTLFNGEVRAAVEVERLLDPPTLYSGCGTEFSTGFMRPEAERHLWIKITNYLSIEQARILETWVQNGSFSSPVSGQADSEGVEVVIWEWKDDDQTVHALGEPGWGSTAGPLIFAEEESKVFLVCVRFGQQIPEGEWRVRLLLR